MISFCMFCSGQSQLFWNLWCSFHMSYFSLERLSIVLLCTHISAQCLDNLLCKTKNCSCAVDAHIHNGVTYMSCTVSYEMAGSTLYMNYCHEATLRLAKMQDEHSLTLHWRTLPGWGNERVDIDFATNGCEYLIDRYLQPIATQITPGARPRIIDAPLLLILRMGYGACWYSFCL
jgi:hypothetical protein